MKLHPPKLAIDPNDPYQHALFNRKALAQSLTLLLRNLSDSLVVLVHAPWGEGKTTFSEMWQADLQKQGLRAIYFDAYKADYFDDPFVCFSGEILGFAKQHFPKATKERGAFKKTAIDVGKRLAGLTTKVAIKASTLGALGSADLHELKNISSDLAAGLADIGSATVEKKIENYTAEKDALAAFTKTLGKLATVVRTQQSFPLTVIVDELDRCRPSFALALLERIKHLFDVPDVAFVLLVNKDQIEGYIRAVYGNVDAHSYLLKFANVFVDLPYQGSEYQHEYEKGRAEYSQILFAHHDLSQYARDGRFLAHCLAALVEHFSLTLREIEKVFVVLSLYYSSVPPGHRANEFLLATLSVLKVGRPSLYSQLRSGSMSLDTFLSETRLNLLNSPSHSPDPEWLKALLSLFLMTDEELEAALKTQAPETRDQSLLSRLRAEFPTNRRAIIPAACSALDRFALKP